MHPVKIIPPKGKLEGAKLLFQKLSPSPLKERGIQVEDSSRGEVENNPSPWLYPLNL
jgi:hypothetical protein